MQFLTIVKTILSLFPLIVQAISTIESQITISGQGAAKLDLIKQILSGSAEISNDVSSGQFEALWPAVQKTVNAVVGLFNGVGIFKKG